MDRHPRHRFAQPQHLRAPVGNNAAHKAFARPHPAQTPDRGTHLNRRFTRKLPCYAAINRCSAAINHSRSMWSITSTSKRCCSFQYLPDGTK